MDGGARFTGLALQASMLNEVLRAFAATDFSSPALPADPAQGRPFAAVSPTTGPDLAAGSLAVRGADGAVRDLPPADPGWAGSASEPDPARSLAGLRAPTRAGETSSMAGAAGAGGRGPSGAMSPPDAAPEFGPSGRDAAADRPAASQSSVGPHGEPVQATKPSPAADGAPEGGPSPADPAEVGDGSSARPALDGAAGEPAAPVRPEPHAIEGGSPTLDWAPGAAADVVLAGGGGAALPAEPATAARPQPGDASSPDEARRSNAPAADVRGAGGPSAAASTSPVTRRAAAADVDFRGDGRRPDRAEAGDAPGQPAALHPTAEPLPPVRHAAARDIDLRFFSDAAGGAPLAGGSLDAAAPAAMLVFNAAMIPGWPPPRPFDMPDAEEMLARLTGSPLLAGREDELEARLGTPAVAGAATRLLRRLPRSRRLRALLGLAALMDAVEAVIEAVEGELLELSRLRREDDGDWSEAVAGRRWTA